MYEAVSDGVRGISSRLFLSIASMRLYVDAVFGSIRLQAASSRSAPYLTARRRTPWHERYACCTNRADFRMQSMDSRVWGPIRLAFD